MTDYDKLLEEVRALGMDYRWATMFITKLQQDEEAFEADEATKKWALEKGFYPGRVQLYGLTEENYKLFVPDYQYFMLHPMNNHFLKWLDKLTLKYVLNSNGCEDTMPEYYAYVENELWGKTYTYLMDCPKDIKRDKDFLWNLLNKKGVLMMKPNSGTSGGLGVIKLEVKDGKIYENNKEITFARFDEIRDTMSNYIITEYVHQHHELNKIWPDSECTLRIIMARDPRKDKYADTTWSCIHSFARFGSKLSGGASNLCSGGVATAFDFETGKMSSLAYRSKRFAEEGKFLMDKHPDTGFVWEGSYLPNWEVVKGKINKICDQMASLDYLGLDVIISEDGMKLCEINSHPAIDYEQMESFCGPTLRKEKAREYFTQKGLFDIDAKAFADAYYRCQK